MNTPNKEDAVTLEILQAIDGGSGVTQRGIAERLGVALGLANSYLKRCVKKGLIKIKTAPANRYAYYLTPKGFAEKSRLTAEYLTYSFQFYRLASGACGQAYGQCRAERWNRILLCGVSELAEIASLRAREHAIELLGVFDPSSEAVQFIGLPVWHNLAEAPRFDACLLTALSDPAPLYEMLTAAAGCERVLVPEILEPVLRVRQDAK